MVAILQAGTGTPEWFVQTLIDMGFTASEALDYFNSTRNTSPTPVAELPGEANFTDTLPWQARHYWPSIRRAKAATFLAPAHRTLLELTAPTGATKILDIS